MSEGIRYLRLASLVGAACAIGFSSTAKAAITVDGALDGAYGGPLATQTVNSGFGDSVIGDGSSVGGSELDAAYGTVSGGYLYLFLSGNFENNGNHVNLFIADGRAGGQSVLNANGGPLNGANGLTFPAGFTPTLALDGNDYSNNMYFDTFDLVGNSSSYIGSVGVGAGNNSGTLSGGILVGINNTNAAGVVSGTGAANPAAANAVSTGLELGIPLSSLGPGPYQVVAAIDGGGDGYLSNQILGALPGGTGNLGSPGGVNLNGLVTPFVVPVPEPTTGLVLMSAGAALLVRRRNAIA